jgi:hypothetical protein
MHHQDMHSEKKESDSECENCQECGQQKNKTNMDKWRYTLYTTILFLIVVNPMTYKLVNMILGKIAKIADKSGCPTTVGMLVHALVFTLLLRGLMELKI